MAYSSKAVANTTCGCGPSSARSTSKPFMPGICTSRKTRPGRRSWIICTASTPFDASPMSSTPSTRARKPESRSRDSFSSSTTSVRMSLFTQPPVGPVPPCARRLRRRAPLGVGRSRSLLDREAEADDGAASGDALDLREMIGAVQALQALTQVAQPDAAIVDLVQDALRHPEPVVADRERQQLAVDAGVDRHRADPELARPTVLYGVLHQRLQDQVRDQLAEAQRVDASLDAQALVESRALDVEVRGRDPELLLERDELLLGAVQDVAEDVSEALDARLRLVGIDVDELRDRVQAVEEEVRVDLRP